MRTILLTLLASMFFSSISAAPLAAEFSFAAVVSLEEMHAFGRRSVKLGSPRDAVRQIFVSQGGAKRYSHPDQDGVEKYVYDINLCRLYVWRWNISANYDAGGRLTQLYVNGEPVHANGDPAIDVAARAKGGGSNQAIYRGAMPRPEADRGESSLAFILFDTDTRSRSTSDEFIMGAGPSRADPRNLGKLHTYEVEWWRSIFAKEGPKVVKYAGACP
jgi:hypothetical protein